MQPEVIKNITPTYRYFSIKNDLAPVQSLASGHFMYIGQFTENFDLINAELNNGTAVSTLTESRKLLAEMGKSGNIPTTLFVDLSVFANDIQSFVDFLQKDSKLSAIPVILNIRNLTADQVASFKSKRVVDDLIDFKVELSSIHQKITFLRKTKESLVERKGSIKPEYNSYSVYKQSHLFKRSMDMFMSFSLLVILLPVFLIIALAVKLETRGPVFYKSYRAGRGYRIFKFYKFRTMKVGAERMINSIAHLNKYNNFGHAPVFFKVDNDPRITRVGQFLRNSGLDELPQLLNVLIGDMSIVGNRPLPLYEASSLTNNEWAERFSAPSGITGLWQVSCRKSESFTCYDRMIMDIEYSKHNNVLMDLGIMLKTPVVLAQGLINNEEEENHMHPVQLQAELSQA
jgi:lipopolysaccharide/colanic/teichoic acid biosynthesis glycosyltransferase